MQNEADQEEYLPRLCLQNAINVHIFALMNQLGVRKEISGDMIMPWRDVFNFGLLGGGRAVAVADEVTKQRNLMIEKIIEKSLEESYTMGCGKGKKKGKGSKK